MTPSNELALAMVAQTVDGTAVVGRWHHRDDWFATAHGSDGQIFEIEASTSDQAVLELVKVVRAKLIERHRDLTKGADRVSESLARLPETATVIEDNDD